MPEALRLSLAFAAGLVLGALFFVGLWWTVTRCLTARRPALWLLGSLLVRTAALLAGFYWVSDGSWRRLVACGLGFVSAKLLVTWLLLPPHVAVQGERVHAP